jgi:hypothetical protein
VCFLPIQQCLEDFLSQGGIVETGRQLVLRESLLERLELLLLVPTLGPRIEIFFGVYRQRRIELKHQALSGSVVFHFGDRGFIIRLPTISPGNDTDEHIGLFGQAQAHFDGRPGTGGKNFHSVPHHPGHGDGILHYFAAIFVVEVSAGYEDLVGMPGIRCGGLFRGRHFISPKVMGSRFRVQRKNEIVQPPRHQVTKKIY